MNIVCRQGFCLNLERTYNIKFQVNDVTVIRGLSSEEPYIKLKGQQIPLDMKKMIGELHLPSSGIYSKNPARFEFLSNNFEIYHPTVPVALIVKESFYMRW